MGAGFGFGEIPSTPEEKKEELPQEVRGLEDVAAEQLARATEQPPAVEQPTAQPTPEEEHTKGPKTYTFRFDEGGKAHLENEARLEKEAQELKPELERTPEAEREKMGVGFQNYGLFMKEGVSNWKSERLEWIAKTQLKEKGAVAGYLSSLAETYRKDAKKARDSMESYQKARTRGTLASAGYLAGNAVKIGRTIADFTGATAAAPLRYAMMTGMFLSRGADAAKEYRLKNEEVVAKTRIENMNEAAEAAWKIYDAAKGRAGAGEVTAKDFEKAYRDQLPEDILARLEAKSPEQAGLVNRAVQGIMRAHMKWQAGKVERKVSKIEEDKKTFS